MQTSDFGSSQERVGVSVRQVSAKVGVGVPGRANVGNARALPAFDSTLIESGWTRYEQPYLRLTRNGSSTTWAGVNFAALYGKWYFEFLVEGTATTDLFLGISEKSPPTGGVNDTQNRLWRANSSLFSGGAGQTGVAYPSALSGTYNVLMFAWDATNGRLYIGKNGEWGDAKPWDDLDYQFTFTPSANWRPVIATSNDGQTPTVTFLRKGTVLYTVPDTFMPI
jgi:hypothetical protein